MRNQKTVFSAVTALFVLLTAVFVMAAGNEVGKVSASAEVLNGIMSIPEMSIPESALMNAHAVAVIPHFVSLSFGLGVMGVGGRQGRGILVVRTFDGNWSSPVFVTLTGGDTGSETGLESKDIVLVFRNHNGVDAMKRGLFTLGTDVSATPGPVGRYAWPYTEEQVNADVYTYAFDRGLVTGVDLGEIALETDHPANESFYATPDITPDAIVATRVGMGMPPAARQFACVVARHSHTAQAQTCS